MDDKTARLLLRSLLERLEADAQRDAPHLLAAVSHLERTALKQLLSSEEKLAPVKTPPSEVESSAEVVDKQLVGSEEEPRAELTSMADAELPAQRMNGAAPLEPGEDTESEPSPATPAPLAVGPRQDKLILDQTSLEFERAQDGNVVLCLDFGTARSKAFAAVATHPEDEDPELIELGLGKRDGDSDAIYTLASSVWISDEGLLYVGSEAIRKSQILLGSGSVRRRLDSVKQQLTLVSYEQNLAARNLEKELNPTDVVISYEDAVCLFLAYLTDLAVTELAAHGKSRYVRRRFTIPSWQPAQRSWAGSALAKYMVRAQILADTFHGRWQNGIPVGEWKSAITEASRCDTRLAYLRDGASDSKGILEPIAAGSGRVWSDSTAKNLVFVLDVGAGTTDFSLFWVVQNIGPESPRRAFQVTPCSDAIRMAGDFIDEQLLVQLINRAHGCSDELVRRRIEADLRNRGLRVLKERLFTTGEIQVALVSDQTVSISREEFLSNDKVKAVGQEIEKAIERFLSSVRPSWSAVTGNAQIVLTGGGAAMPNIKALADRVWEIGGEKVSFRRAEDIPEYIRTRFDLDFQREYPQLAVAIGGVLPLLDEKSRLEEYMGSAKNPGALPKYQVTGL
jgi:molecular chaperone HscA